MEIPVLPVHEVDFSKAQDISDTQCIPIKNCTTNSTIPRVNTPPVGDPQAIRSVISSADTHPDAPPLIEKLKSQYKDVVFHPRLARDVGPKLRGPFGVARI